MKIFFEKNSKLKKILVAVLIVLVAIFATAFYQVKKAKADTVAYNTITKGEASGAGTSFSYAHNVGTGTNKILIVGVAFEAGTLDNVSGVTYNGVAMTKIGTGVRVGTTFFLEATLWYLTDDNLPDDNANHDVIVSYPTHTDTAIESGAVSLYNAKQAAPTDLGGSGYNDATNPVTKEYTTTADNMIVVDVVGCGNLGSYTATGQTERWDDSVGTSGNTGAGGTRALASAGTYTNSWTYSSTVNRQAMYVAGVETAPVLPTVTTQEPTSIAQTTATGNGNVTADGYSTILERGTVWSTSANPTTSDNKFTSAGTTGAFTTDMTGFSAGQTYHVRAYAINAVGTSYGDDVQFNTSAPSFSCGDASCNGGENCATCPADCGACVPNPQGVNLQNNVVLKRNTIFKAGGAVAAWACGNSVVSNIDGLTYGSVTGEDGKCWLDRNLGATQVAAAYNDSAAYGWLYQWGRLYDGHQIPTSGTTATNSSGDVPGHANFITEGSSPYDWRVPQNDNLWQGVSGTNNPCPTGWRVPTQGEWDAWTTAAGVKTCSSSCLEAVYNTSLKLPAAGDRYMIDAVLYDQGSAGRYWSSSPEAISAYLLLFSASTVDPMNYGVNERANAFSVRCVKD